MSTIVDFVLLKENSGVFYNLVLMFIVLAATIYDIILLT